ncbi:hypothetical protein [Alteromonas antoniana]|uniref:type IVB secretion system protein IcmW n=1 Tax=Alteromonas antoniana TaxID=2803813 RepID=UPI001C43810D|nr:hypothetical protein [Alteromonas antoniana]
MITDTDIDDFINSLSSHLQVLIARVSSKETWSSDDDAEIKGLINELSSLLEKTSDTTLSRASHLLLTNGAYFSLPRFLRFISSLAERNPRLINQMLSPFTADKIPDGKVYLSTVINRLRYMVQSILVGEIFDPETMKRIQVAVLDHERESLTAKPHSPAESFIDLSGDEPFSSQDSTPTSESVIPENKLNDVIRRRINEAKSTQESRADAPHNEPAEAVPRPIGYQIKTAEVHEILQSLTNPEAESGNDE